MSATVRRTNHNIPSTPKATKTLAKRLTFLSSDFHVSSPTSVASFSSVVSSVDRARRRDGEDVIMTIDSSVSSVRERVERLEEPKNVKNGLEPVGAGESHRPVPIKRVSTTVRQIEVGLRHNA